MAKKSDFVMARIKALSAELKKAGKRLRAAEKRYLENPNIRNSNLLKKADRAYAAAADKRRQY